MIKLEHEMAASAPHGRLDTVGPPADEEASHLQRAIRLVERQGGTVVGLAAVAIEENAATDAYRAKYRCVSGVVQGSRWQKECNAQKLESFKSYKPELVFPTVR